MDHIAGALASRNCPTSPSTPTPGRCRRRGLDRLRPGHLLGVGAAGDQRRHRRARPRRAAGQCHRPAARSARPVGRALSWAPPLGVVLCLGDPPPAARSSSAYRPGGVVTVSSAGGRCATCPIRRDRAARVRRYDGGLHEGPATNTAVAVALASAPAAERRRACRPMSTTPRPQRRLRAGSRRTARRAAGWPRTACGLPTAAGAALSVGLRPAGGEPGRRSPGGAAPASAPASIYPGDLIPMLRHALDGSHYARRAASSLRPSS